MTTIACYIRVSTTEQNEASQLAEIHRWLQGHGIAEDARFYVDKSTGDNLNRPEFERLQRDIFNGEIKTVVVYKLDRLSRKMADGIAVLSNWLDQGVRFVSVTQGFDFAGTVGKMVAAVILGVAEMEQETRRERQADGIAEAKERGVYLGRRAGTTKAKPTRAKQLRDRGLTHSEIATALDVSRRTVIRYLQTA